MRLPFPRYLLAGVSKGSIADQDAELEVPATVVPIALVGTPIDESAVPPDTETLEQSFVGGRDQTALGVAAGASVGMTAFGKGLWYVSGVYRIQFAGTTNGANTGRLSLTSKDGSITISTWMESRIITGLQLAVRIDTWLSLRESGCRFVLSSPTTVAADIFSHSFRFLATKIF